MYYKWHMVSAWFQIDVAKLLIGWYVILQSVYYNGNPHCWMHIPQPWCHQQYRKVWVTGHCAHCTQIHAMTLRKWSKRIRRPVSCYIIWYNTLAFFFFREVVRLCPKNDKGLHNLDSRIWHLKCTNSGLMKPCEKKDINDQQSKQRWDWTTTNWKDTLTAKISTVNMITAYLDTAFNARVWTTKTRLINFS